MIALSVVGVASVVVDVVLATLSLLESTGARLLLFVLLLLVLVPMLLLLSVFSTFLFFANILPSLSISCCFSDARGVAGAACDLLLSYASCAGSGVHAMLRSPAGDVADRLQ